MERVGGANPLPIAPTGPISATVELPGSKSITNRALMVAALADGPSTLTGVLDADDTRAMVGVLVALGARIEPAAPTTLTVSAGVDLDTGPTAVSARMSGTTARFALPLLALGRYPHRLDAHEQMRARPMGPSLDALGHLGATVTVAAEDASQHLPVIVTGPLRTGQVHVAGDTSSQFVSGLLLVAPCVDGGLSVTIDGDLVSRPYVDLTVGLMEAFGARVAVDGQTWTVAGTGYVGRDHDIEPDASAASYAWAAGLLTGGAVTVPGLHRRSLQGDVGVVDVFEAMGARVAWHDDAITVAAGDGLRGVDVDMAHISDTVMTVAVVAACASGPTTIRNIGFIRHKETDRMAATVTELRRCGVDATATDEDLVIRPGPIQPAVIKTYDDHRMAMSFSLLGLVAPGIAIADPDCVAKTFPGYWDFLDCLHAGSFPAARPV